MGEFGCQSVKSLGAGAVLAIFSGCSAAAVQGGRGSSASGTGTGATSVGAGSAGASSSGTGSGGGTSGGAAGGSSSTTGGEPECLLTICPLVDGGTACVDPSRDTFNCGRCGNFCARPESDCIRGECLCPNLGSVCEIEDSGVTLFCASISNDPFNCGTCGNECEAGYATGSSCRAGKCTCMPGQTYLCVDLPATSPPTCGCDAARECASPSFATDVYPMLAQQSGDFGCAASGCHSGARPAGALGFLDPTGEMDAGMAHAELMGLGGEPDGGAGLVSVPGCDAGIPGAPSSACLCLSRVVAGHGNASVLIDLLLDNPPLQCSGRLGMPLDDAGQYAPLSPCALQLIEGWVNSGANP